MGTATESKAADQLDQRQVEAAHVVVFAAFEAMTIDENGRGVPELRRAIASLHAAGVPVVAWSKRTRAEIEVLRRQLDIHAPFISEDGAALFVPSGCFHFPLLGTRPVGGYEALEFGSAYDSVVWILRNVADALRVRVTTLGEMTIEEASRELGTSLLNARLAKLREYGELFRVEDDRSASRGRLLRGLRAVGLTCSPGTPFDHVSGVGDRGVALQTVYALFRRAYGRIVAVGIGSTPDALPVLQAADVRILIAGCDGRSTTRMVEQMPLAHVVQEDGIQGWTEAMTRVASRSFANS